MNLSKLAKKYFKSTEEIVSMFLGLVIVVVVSGMIFNFIQKRKGSVTIPGVSDISITKDDLLIKEKEVNNEDNYVVLANDSLWKIAVYKYNNGYAWTEIAKVNSINTPNRLEVGQKLIIPKIDKKEVLTSNNNLNKTITTKDYKVIKNDSLWKIAVREYGDGYQWTKIWQENKSKIVDPNKIEIGMILVIPSLK
jgi:nucleoid-associated protein YgaU